MPVGIWKVGDTRHILRYAEDTEDILLDMLGSVLCKNLKIFTSRRKTRGLQPQASRNQKISLDKFILPVWAPATSHQLFSTRLRDLKTSRPLR
jgi:hypothetical protein